MSESGKGDTAGEGKEKPGEQKKRPPTLIGWIVRIVSAGLLAVLIGTLVYETLQPEREVTFKTEAKWDELRFAGGRYLLPVDVTNQGTKTAHTVRLIVTDGAEKRTLEMARIGQNETISFVVGWTARPRAIAAHIESYEQP